MIFQFLLGSAQQSATRKPTRRSNPSVRSEPDSQQKDGNAEYSKQPNPQRKNVGSHQPKDTKMCDSPSKSDSDQSTSSSSSSYVGNESPPKKYYRSGFSFAPGARVEARDFTETWLVFELCLSSRLYNFEYFHLCIEFV